MSNHSQSLTMISSVFGGTAGEGVVDKSTSADYTAASEDPGSAVIDIIETFLSSSMQVAARGADVACTWGCTSALEALLIIFAYNTINWDNRFCRQHGPILIIKRNILNRKTP